MCPIFVGSEVVGSSLYQKNICDESTHLYLRCVKVCISLEVTSLRMKLDSWTLFSSKLDSPVIKTSNFDEKTHY